MTQWFNSFVYRQKQNGRLRLHLNAKDLNAAIQIEHHVALTLEEILLNVKDAKVFSIREKKNADTETWSREKSLLTSLHLRGTGSDACPLASKYLKSSSRLRGTKIFFPGYTDSKTVKFLSRNKPPILRVRMF